VKIYINRINLNECNAKMLAILKECAVKRLWGSKKGPKCVVVEKEVRVVT
jgi:hypothetical protein